MAKRLFRSIVVATSNGAGKLQEAFLQRFTILRYDASQVFPAACQARLTEIWAAEFGNKPLPAGVDRLGFTGGEFSMRKAIDYLQANGLAGAR